MRRSLTFAFIAVAILVAIAAPALASGEPASGTFVEGPETILEESESGGNVFVHLTREAVISGTYNGVGQADQYIVIHADGTFNFRQTIDFTGEVCGEPVTLTFRNVGTGDFTTNTLNGQYTVIGGPPVGRGTGTITAVPGVGGTYEGQVHCE